MPILQHNMYYATMHETALNAPEWDVLIEVPLNLRVVCSAYCVAVKFLCNTRVKYWMANIIRILSMASSISHVRDDSFGVRRGQIFSLKCPFSDHLLLGTINLCSISKLKTVPVQNFAPRFQPFFFRRPVAQTANMHILDLLKYRLQHDRDVARQI